jgi:hypothetical protein
MLPDPGILPSRVQVVWNGRDPLGDIWCGASEEQ